MQSADQQLLSQIESVIDQSNRELASDPAGNSIQDVIYKQQKQIILRHVQSLNKFYQQEVRKEKAYENDFRLATNSAVNALDFNQDGQIDQIDPSTLQTVELSQQLTIQQTRDNKFSKIVNTLQDIATLQKQVASQVEMQGQNIYRIGENIDNTDKQVTRSNELLQRTLKNIRGRQGCLIKVFVFVLLYIVVKNLWRRFVGK